MAIGSPSKAARLDQLRGYARVQVWSGYADDDALRRDVLEAVLDEVADEQEAVAYTDELIRDARAELVEAAAGWPAQTPYDRFQQAVRALESHDIVVLEACADHWAADAELRRHAETGNPLRGIAYFTPADVWHAVDHGMLEVNVWHADTSNVRKGDELIIRVQSVLAEHGLRSVFDEGRLEVTLAWQRRPLTAAP